MKREKLKIIGHYINPLQAMIDKNHLILEGIPAKVVDVKSIQNNHFYKSQLGTAKLLVPEGFVEKSSQILESKRISCQN